ncbi:hypothetical protein BVER_05652 [Candidatus Burkholderia verschuerenii]|uniref:Uncharacterized protein n=1 Tax=Candidatus Burkholderia verschuerenii TaxID=242163 RepID=A0A0L0ME92_9BURK|nr:hypothetical protein [Candidatus Burkholderia verschuerenii]KND60575.1 hypothetical protein BVER_05652 [Candidatus Burkholderia verschuerenii]
MAKAQRITPESMGKERDRKAAELAASMPEDRAGLLAVTAEATAEFHAAVLACDDAAAQIAADRYDAAVWKLNGGTSFGVMDSSNPEAGGILAEAHCRADAGTVPMWNQTGEFLITVQGVRAVVRVRDGFGRFRVSMGFHVVDADKPFISETGYRSHFDTARGGRTVDEVAISVFTALLAEKRIPLAPEYRQRRGDEAAPAWLAELAAPDAGELVFEDRAGQMAFGF